jgi:hypothetical protein
MNAVLGGFLVMSLTDTLREEKKRLLRDLNAVEAHLRAIGGELPNKRTINKAVKKVVRKGKRMSEATKAKLRAAAKARWAKIKKIAK